MKLFIKILWKVLVIPYIVVGLSADVSFFLFLVLLQTCYSMQTDNTITLADGKTYRIVKERLGYIIKSGLNESSLEYNDPIKHRKHFRSYSEAMKKLGKVKILFL